VLVITPPAFAWLGARAALWYGRSKLSGAGKTALVSVFAAANAAFFLAAPVYCSHRGVRDFEATLGRVKSAFAQQFNPRETLIVAFDSHFLGYRHAAWYLPDFLTVQYPAVRFSDGPRVVAVEQRDTVLLRAVPAGRFKNFVLFPLPEGREYRDYLARRVLPRFPAALGALRVGSQVVLTGPADQVEHLFPAREHEANTAVSKVSTVGHNKVDWVPLIAP
jgi:hypothetical protein